MSTAHDTFDKFFGVVKGFIVSATASAIGATAVYPIDLIKTRMQNQRRTANLTPDSHMYKNSWDCFRQVVRNEGFFRLYRGLIPYLGGQVPEKAMRLFVVDKTRTAMDRTKLKIFKSKEQKRLFSETVAGTVAGTFQVLITNPAEIVKVRLQILGAQKTSTEATALTILKELGFSGMYQGASACFLRDIPFSAIYFPSYYYAKKVLSQEMSDLKTTDLLLAGSIAGMMAASLTTPADVIKTRLQASAKMKKRSMFSVAAEIWREEGFWAFWKGTGPRVFRSSPQYGVMLVAYEILLRMVFGDRKDESAQRVDELLGAEIFEDRWRIQHNWEPPKKFTQNIKHLSQVSVGAQGSVWGIGPENTPVLWNGWSWITIQNAPKMKSISAGADGSAWGVDIEGAPYVWDPWQRTFVRQPRPKGTKELAKISVGNMNKVWGVSNDGQTWKWNRRLLSWKLQAKTPMSVVSVGSDGTTVALNSEGEPHLWDSLDNKWIDISDSNVGPLNSVSVGTMKSIWGSTESGELWRFELRPREWNGTWERKGPESDLEMVSAAGDGTVIALHGTPFNRKKRKTKKPQTTLQAIRNDDL